MGLENEKLAIHGGAPVRATPMPFREAFGDAEVEQLMRAVEYYRARNEDPPYQGVFEKEFCDGFVAYMDGGYADGVSTGTAACYVALAALELPKGSEVIISPVTDSGPLNCIIMQGLVPVVADAKPDSYNIGVEQFLARVTPRTRGLLAVHSSGEPLETDRIVEAAHARNIRVVEDCSQAPGAVWNGKKVGGVGDIAAFSTMYRKTLATGGSGGLVYCRDQDLYRRALSHADRGKPVWRTDVNLADPSYASHPALNFNNDEFSAAIGIASLRRLQDAIDRRVAFVERLIERMEGRSRFCRPYAFHRGFSPFFFPIFVDTDRLTCGKIDFAKALAAEGIPVNLHYGCVISGWKWAEPYLSDGFVAKNAMKTRDTSFNLFLNEHYGEAEARDIVDAIEKLERFFAA